jgi:hypothetical protein
MGIVTLYRLRHRRRRVTIEVPESDWLDMSLLGGLWMMVAITAVGVIVAIVTIVAIVLNDGSITWQ